MAALGSSRRRLLFITPFPPRKDAKHGGARVIANVLERLADRHEIALVHLEEAGDQPLDEHLRRRLALAERVQRVTAGSRRGLLVARASDVAGLARLQPRLVRELEAPHMRRALSAVVDSWQPELVQVEYAVLMKYRGSLQFAGPLVLVDHDPAVPIALQACHRRRGLGRTVGHLEVIAWRRFERRALEAADAVVAFTDLDVNALRALDPSTRIEKIPFGVDLPEEPLDPIGGDPPQILFVGSFVHPPNIDAAERLARHIFPRIAGERRDATLCIVGHRPPPAIHSLSGDGIEVHADVPDVTPYLRRAAVVAIPVRFGGGMRVKLLEALAAGKAVVASARAAEGLDLVPGEHLLLAETDAEFADAVGQLVRDPKRRLALGRRARAWIDEHASWDRTIDALEALYESLLRSPSPAAAPRSVPASTRTSS